MVRIRFLKTRYLATFKNAQLSSAFCLNSWRGKSEGLAFEDPKRNRKNINCKKNNKKYQLETQRLYAKILLIFNLFYTLSF